MHPWRTYTTNIYGTCLSYWTLCWMNVGRRAHSTILLSPRPALFRPVLKFQTTKNSSSGLPYSSLPMSPSLSNPSLNVSYGHFFFCTHCHILGGIHISCQDNGTHLLPVLHRASTLVCPHLVMLQTTSKLLMHTVYPVKSFRWAVWS